MSNLKKVLSSSFLISGEAVLRKLVGIVSTMILARLLVPEDFGLIAIAIVVMSFIDAMKQFGGAKYLLKSETINLDMINTSWTINFSSNLCMALLLVIAAPFIADFYTDDRLIEILWAFAGIWVIRSLGNPALVMLRRDQNYLPIVKLSIITKIIAIIVVIISSVTFKSYWALVLGQLTTYSLNTIGGYFLYHHRLSFCLKNVKEQWNFSGWWMLQSFVGFLKAQLDTLLVSSMFDKSALGSYHTIKYYASMPISFLLEPASEPLLVELRKIKDNKHYFNQQYNVSFIFSFVIAAPITLFLMQEHYLIVATLLGDNWLEYSELMAIFCLSIIAFNLQRQALDVIVILGSAKSVFYFQTFSFVMIYGILIYTGVNTVIEFAEMKVGLELAIAIVFFIFITLKYTSFSTLVKLIIGLSPIVLSLLLSYYLTPEINDNYPIVIQLLGKAIPFFTIYLITMVIMGYILKSYSKEWQYLWNLSERFFPARLTNNKQG